MLMIFLLRLLSESPGAAGPSLVENPEEPYRLGVVLPSYQRNDTEWTLPSLPPGTVAFRLPYGRPPRSRIL
jgi:hypothetical protein